MRMNELTEEEIQEIRSNTRGTAEVIHFNNAGAALPPDIVVETMVNYLHEEATYGGYETSAKYQSEVDNTYTLIANLINAEREEIAILENASTAWSIAFNGIDFKNGDEIITSEMEYITNVLGYLNAKQNYGVVIHVIKNDELGNFPIAALEAQISAKTKLIAITHIASTSGSVLPVEEIGRIAKKYEVLYLLDACQSVGHMPVNVERIQCDMLSVTGRKYLRAPRGTGFLYVRMSAQDKLKVLFMDSFSTEWVTENGFKLRAGAKRFELFEKNRALVLGLGKAVEYALNIGIDRIWLRIQLLANFLRQELQGIDGVIIHDLGDHLSGIVTFSVRGVSNQLVMDKLSEEQINVTVGVASSTLFYMNNNKLPTVVRASVHYYNTIDEIEILCAELREISQHS
jgi:cysteine desulfurase/selenocysteine lyase